MDDENPWCGNKDCPYHLRSYTRAATWYNPHMFCLNCMDDMQRDNLVTRFDGTFKDDDQ